MKKRIGNPWKANKNDRGPLKSVCPLNACAKGLQPLIIVVDITCSLAKGLQTPKAHAQHPSWWQPSISSSLCTALVPWTASRQKMKHRPIWKEPLFKESNSELKSDIAPLKFREQNLYIQKDPAATNPLKRREVSKCVRKACCRRCSSDAKFRHVTSKSPLQRSPSSCRVKAYHLLAPPSNYPLNKELTQRR